MPFTDTARLRAAALIVLLAMGSATGALAQPPLEALPSILQLDLSQRPAWRTYRDAAAESRAEGAHEAARVVQLNALTTPARLDALRGALRVQQITFEREAAAATAFYAVLSPDQRRVFDEMTRLPVQSRPSRRGAGFETGSAATSALSGRTNLDTRPTGAYLPPPRP